MLTETACLSWYYAYRLEIGDIATNMKLKHNNEMVMRNTMSLTSDESPDANVSWK